MPPKGKGDLDLARQKQEQEVMEYLRKEIPETYETWPLCIELTVSAIVRRYELFDCEDRPGG